MIYIKKGAEPKSLKEYRSQPNATYEDFRDKDDIREALLKEQGCLCAYCMSRISKDKMKIEHWISQKSEEGDGEEKALDFHNMLGVCTGYRADGTIYSENVLINRDLNETLNLNCERAYLKANRKATITALQKFCLRQRQNGTWDITVLKKAEQYFGQEKEGMKRPYLGAILFFINRYSQKNS